MAGREPTKVSSMLYEGIRSSIRKRLALIEGDLLASIDLWKARLDTDAEEKHCLQEKVALMETKLYLQEAELYRRRRCGCDATENLPYDATNSLCDEEPHSSVEDGDSNREGPTTNPSRESTVEADIPAATRLSTIYENPVLPSFPPEPCDCEEGKQKESEEPDIGERQPLKKKRRS
ncbi:hypothetical protein DM02DRAFT_663216 [Periconia macrospinosa]|uniref:Uncharacterized protein n=1 Tax=Periconia macrospinosa TaxID=97972 RepID=A0A2V1D2A8_9PLEO|nr:hypothetical protein DM02DRAFT_663216 [Periconia macrospinosa]